jgi:hypothetical protein
MTSNYKLISFIGGILFDVAVFGISTHSLYLYGVELNLMNNHSRQTILNLFCLIGTVNGFINHPVNYIGFSILLSNITVFITFTMSLYGLMIMYHNTAIRAQSVIQLQCRELVEKSLLLLYALPPLFLIPMYFAAAERLPLNQSINASSWNRDVYKPIGLTLVLTCDCNRYFFDI